MGETRSSILDPAPPADPVPFLSWLLPLEGGTSQCLWRAVAAHSSEPRLGEVLRSRLEGIGCGVWERAALGNFKS